MRQYKFNVTRANTSEVSFKLVAYPSGGANFPVESTVYWPTREEAEAACERVNAGDETGVKFASYSDD